MAKRKGSKMTGGWPFGFGQSSRSTKQSGMRSHRTFVRFAAIFAVACAIAAVGVGFFFLERYVKDIAQIGQKIVPLELVDMPEWVSDRLEEKIRKAATGAKGKLVFDENTASSVEKRLASIAWLEDVKVHATTAAVSVFARYRKPIAWLKPADLKFCIDPNCVVMDYVDTPKLSLIEIRGVSSSAEVPCGAVWHKDDLAAAVSMIKLFEKMDKISIPPRPLLGELESIDVTNFAGRKNSHQPHITLGTKDGTQIYWGAQVGQSQKYLEAEEKEKLAMLYAFYGQHGTLQNVVKYIELRYPQRKIPQPINNYLAQPPADTH